MMFTNILCKRKMYIFYWQVTKLDKKLYVLNIHAKKIEDHCAKLLKAKRTVFQRGGLGWYFLFFFSMLFDVI